MFISDKCSHVRQWKNIKKNRILLSQNEFNLSEYQIIIQIVRTVCNSTKKVVILKHLSKKLTHFSNFHNDRRQKIEHKWLSDFM